MNMYIKNNQCFNKTLWRENIPSVELPNNLPLAMVLGCC